MANAYSYDLRIRAVMLVNNGKAVNAVAETLSIGRTTLHAWLKKSRKGMDIKPRLNWQKGYGHKITDLEKFKKFIDDNSDLNLTELAEKWGNVNRSTIDRTL